MQSNLEALVVKILCPLRSAPLERLFENEDFETALRDEFHTRSKIENLDSHFQPALALLSSHSLEVWFLIAMGLVKWVEGLKIETMGPFAC